MWKLFQKWEILKNIIIASKKNHYNWWNQSNSLFHSINHWPKVSIHLTIRSFCWEKESNYFHSHLTSQEDPPPGVWSCSQFFEKGSNLTCNYTRAGGGVRLMMFLRQRLCISHWGTHTKEGKNPSLTDVNSVSSVKFKEGFKIFFQGITTTPLPLRQSSGHTTAPPQLCLLLSLICSLNKKIICSHITSLCCHRDPPCHHAQTHTEWSRLQMRILKRDKINCIKS